jgi:hypothetical protein
MALVIVYPTGLDLVCLIRFALFWLSIWFLFGWVVNICKFFIPQFGVEKICFFQSYTK